MEGFGHVRARARVHVCACAHVCARARVRGAREGAWLARVRSQALRRSRQVPQRPEPDRPPEASAAGEALRLRCPHLLRRRWQRERGHLAGKLQQAPKAPKSGRARPPRGPPRSRKVLSPQP